MIELDERILLNTGTSIVTDEYLTHHPVRFQSEPPDGKGAEPTSMPKEMTQQEKDVAQQQLKDLGYM